MMIKSVRFIHKWVGVVCGLIILALCLSGALFAVGKLCGWDASWLAWLMRLHRSLYIGKAGHYIVGITTFLCVIEIVSGYWLWAWMAHRAGWRRSLRWTFPNKLMGLHNGVGVWVGMPLLLMALTGLTWSFEWYADVLSALFDFPTIKSLHTGSWLGIPSRLIWIAAATLAASLPITGIIITLKRNRSDV